VLFLFDIYYYLLELQKIGQFCTRAVALFYPSVELFVPSPPLFVVVSERINTPSLLFAANASSEETTNGFSTCFKSGTLMPLSSMHLASTRSFSRRISRSEASLSTADLSFIFSVAYRSNMLPSSSVSACFRSLERLADSLFDCFLLCRFSSRSSAADSVLIFIAAAVALLFVLVLLSFMLMVAAAGDEDKGWYAVAVMVAVVVAALLFNLFLSLVKLLLMLVVVVVLFAARRWSCCCCAVFI